MSIGPVTWAGLSFSSIPEPSIHLREKSIAGPALFDEDDACAGPWNSGAACSSGNWEFNALK
jgi:hypothetical protein